MEDIVQFVGPRHSLRLFGVKLIGIDAENGTKLLFSVALGVVLLGLGRLLLAGSRLFTGRAERLAFWVRQGIHLLTAIALLIGAVSRLILRGRTFNAGDRIVMGGVRGDVIALGFLQTTIMEMGQHAQVFDEPVFNYIREFPYDLRIRRAGP